MSTVKEAEEEEEGSGGKKRKDFHPSSKFLSTLAYHSQKYAICVITNSQSSVLERTLGRPSKASSTPASSPSFGPVTSPILGIWVTCLRRAPEHCRKIERRAEGGGLSSLE
ncbi:hypothetical protein M0802_005181 [Mischocyttarus mexicanus]|nr:hypothetical protein M0802_005181 [Mischocyttarus mexicanus]